MPGACSWFAAAAHSSSRASQDSALVAGRCLYAGRALAMGTFDSLIACSSSWRIQASRLLRREVAAIRNNRPPSPRPVAPTASRNLAHEQADLEARLGKRRRRPNTRAPREGVALSADRRFSSWTTRRLGSRSSSTLILPCVLSGGYDFKSALGSFWLAIDSHGRHGSSGFNRQSSADSSARN